MNKKKSIAIVVFLLAICLIVLGVAISFLSGGSPTDGKIDGNNKKDEKTELLENEKNGHFDYVTVSKAYSLNTLANSLRIEPSTLKKLNPSYHLGFTHPSKKSEIRLPLGMKTAAEEALAKQEPIDFPVKYKVVSGDSLWSISRRYNTTVDAICELNGIRENAILKIGKILYIPSK